jgi:uncharacterized membrane protein
MSDKDKGQAAVYSIVAFNFAGQDMAKQMFRQAKSAGAFEGYDIVVEAIVEQDEKGKVHFHEPGHGVWGAVEGGAVGGLLGLIGGPVGLLAWAVGGAVIGGAAGKYLGRPIKKGDLKEIGEAMSPDSSAILLLLEDKDTEAAVKSMLGYNANVVTLTVGDELSGQIASYMAADVSADQGDEATEETGDGS